VALLVFGLDARAERDLKQRMLGPVVLSWCVRGHASSLGLPGPGGARPAWLYTAVRGGSPSRRDRGAAVRGAGVPPRVGIWLP
jgi:hypothetical protein